MNNAGNGQAVDSGVYKIDGFRATLKGAGGQYQLVPQCLIWPRKGNDPANQIVMEVVISGDRFSGSVLLEGPLAMLFRLNDELEQLIDGARSELKFPSELAIQELMLSTILHLALDPDSDTGVSMRCENATPFLPSRNAPHMRLQLQAERCVTSLSFVSGVSWDALESFRAELSRFQQWLAAEFGHTGPAPN